MSTKWRNKAGWYSAYVKLRKNYLEHNAVHNAGKCQIQIEGVCTGVATSVHHLLGMEVVSPLDTRYWQAACQPCNSKVGDPLAKDPPHMGNTLY